MEPELSPMPSIRSGLAGSLYRHRWLIIGSVLVTALLGYALSLFQTKQYTALARVALADPRGSVEFADVDRTANPDRYVRNQAEFMDSLSVAGRASEILGGSPPATAIRDAVTTTALLNRDLVVVTATATEAQTAADVANAVVDAYEESIKLDVQQAAGEAIAELERSRSAIQARVAEVDVAIAGGNNSSALQAERESAIAQLVTLDTRIEQIQVDVALYGSGIQFVERADAPRSPTSPKPLRNAAAAGFVGLLASGAFAWWRNERNPVASDRLDPVRFLDAPLLGVVPQYDAVAGHAVTVDDPRSPAAEAYQVVATALTLAMEESGASTVAVSSAGGGDGKTTSVVNLAVAARLDGRAPLVVDADERARGLSRVSDHAFSPGLTDLAQRDDLDLGSTVVEWQVGEGVSIDLLPAGTRTNPAAFFRSAEFEKTMARLRDHADLVLVDTPPVPVAAETLDIVSQVDAVLLVVERGTPLRLLADVRERLNLANKPVLGYVYNRAPRSGTSYGYGKWRDQFYGYGAE